jgi:ABC-type multidrug transport system ATPase subunit
MLEVNGLSKRFGGFLAVNQVSFELRAGEILGLIGPNGSGKSTTFNLIAGTLRPSSGSAPVPEIVADGERHARRLLRRGRQDFPQ